MEIRNKERRGPDTEPKNEVF